MILAANNQFARLAGTVRAGHHAHVFVIDTTNPVFFARNRNVLEAPVSGSQPGLKLLNSNGPAELSWEGEIWYIGNAATLTQFDFSID